MKKNINLDEMLNSIAVEEAPENLIYKWKAEVRLQKEKKSIPALLLQPSIIIPLVFAGLWYYLVFFRKELFEYYFLDNLRSILPEISLVISDSTSTLASSTYYIIGAGIFSIIIATISLFWFYQRKKLRYSIVRNR